MSSMNPKLIVFDLNKTLINENSWLKLNQAMGVTEDEDADLLKRAACGKITDSEAQLELLDLYKQRGDVSRAHIAQILTEYTYKPFAREVVAELGRCGYELAIISGAMDILVAQVADELGIALWRAGNQFIFDKNDELINIVAPDNDAEAKLEQLKQLAAERGLAMHNCLVVGDGANDLPLFQATGNGVTFTGSAIADQARWVVDDLSKLLEIVSKA